MGAHSFRDQLHSLGVHNLGSEVERLIRLHEAHGSVKYQDLLVALTRETKRQGGVSNGSPFSPQQPAVQQGYPLATPPKARSGDNSLGDTLFPEASLNSSGWRRLDGEEQALGGASTARSTGAFSVSSRAPFSTEEYSAPAGRGARRQ